MVGKHRIAKEGWSIVATDDLTVQPVPGIEAGKPTIYSEAAQALQKTETGRTRQSRRLEDPSSVGTGLMSAVGRFLTGSSRE